MRCSDRLDECDGGITATLRWAFHFCDVVPAWGQSIKMSTIHVAVMIMMIMIGWFVDKERRVADDINSKKLSYFLAVMYNARHNDAQADERL